MRSTAAILPILLSTSMARGAPDHGYQAVPQASGAVLLTNQSPGETAAADGMAIAFPRALQALRDALTAMDHHQRQHVRIVRWGAPAASFDRQLRALLQAKFGDGGLGFVELSTKYKQPGARIRRSRNRYTLRLAKQRATDTVDLLYRKQPRGGRIDLRIEGKLVARLLTMHRVRKFAAKRYDLLDDARTIEVATTGTTRLYGLDLRKRRGGLLYHRLSARWAALDPALAILSIDGASLEQARKNIRRLRRAAPAAACLILARHDAVNQAKQLARTQGCAVAFGKKISQPAWAAQLAKALIATLESHP